MNYFDKIAVPLLVVFLGFCLIKLYKVALSHNPVEDVAPVTSVDNTAVVTSSTTANQGSQ